MKGQADDLFKGGNYHGAIQLYEKLMELIPYNHSLQAIVYSNISSCYQKNNDLPKALENIKKAVKKDQKYDKAFYRKGEIEKKMGNHVDAEESFKKAQGLNPGLNL